MGVELYLYTLVLPAIGSILPLYILWNAYNEAKNDPINRMRLEEPYRIPELKKEIKFGGRTLDYRINYIITFIILAFILGLEVAVILTILYVIWKKVSKDRAGQEEPKPLKTVKEHIMPWIVILSVLPLAIFAYGIIVYFMLSGKLSWSNISVEFSKPVVTAVGVAIGMGSIGSGVGMALTNKEAVKGLIKRPEIATWVVILSALAEGIALYGLVIAFMIIGKFGILSAYSIRVLFASGLAISITALAAGIAIGYINREAVRGMAEEPAIATWFVILSALAEGLALYGLVIAFMIVGKTEDVSSAGATILLGSALTFGLAAIGAATGLILIVKNQAKDMVKKPEVATWIVIMAALAEGIALYGLVIAFMMIGKVYGYVDPNNAQLLYSSGIIFGVGLIASGLLIGYLPSRIDAGLDRKGMIKRVAAAAIGHGTALALLVWMFTVIGRVKIYFS